MTNSGLHWLDGVVVLAYACGMLAIGWYCGRTQTTTEEYFVGNRAMPPLLVGISMYATLFSTISYLSTPGEIINHGPAMLTNALAIPIAYYVVGYLMLPVYMKYRVISAYELLEMRLGLASRLIGATAFVALRLIWMATLIYFAASALLVMLGIDQTWLSTVTFATTAIAVAYSSIGGMRAVVITDSLQFLLLFVGALLVLLTVSLRLGGFGWIPLEWNSAWDTQPLFRLDPTVRITVFGVILNGVLYWVCTAGSDQAAVQRFMATTDQAAARRSFLANSIAGAAVSLVLALVGFAILAYFQEDLTRLPTGRTIAKDADLLFPHYIAHELPIGLSGLVVAGMFAAAMSSIDSGVNSITAVVMTDYVDRFRKTPISRTAHIRSAISLAVAIGCAVAIGSSFLSYVPGNFLEVSQRLLNLIMAPLFILFVFALFIPFATQAGAIAGSAAALVVAFVIAFSAQLTDLPGISFLWINPLALIAGIIVGCAISALTSASRVTARMDDDSPDSH